MSVITEAVCLHCGTREPAEKIPGMSTYHEPARWITIYGDKIGRVVCSWACAADFALQQSDGWIRCGGAAGSRWMRKIR